MDPLKFEAWLTEIAEWHRPRPADTGRWMPVDTSQIQTGAEIKQIRSCEVPCEWCNNTCLNTSVKRWQLEQTKTGTKWRGYCETCRKKYDPVTQQLGHTPFVKKGVREAQPGNRLGRKPKWWNEVVAMGSADPAERRAELLDRLAALKQSK